MPDALEVVFLRTEHQTCIVHLIRSSTAFISHRDRKAVCDGPKPVYQATDAVEAERALEVFAESPMGKRYPAVAEAWRRAWAQVIPFFRFPPAIRRLIYTTNSIEGWSRAVRKAIKTRTLFPNEEAATTEDFSVVRQEGSRTVTRVQPRRHHCCRISRQQQACNSHPSVGDEGASRLCGKGLRA